MLSRASQFRKISSLSGRLSKPTAGVLPSATPQLRTLSSGRTVYIGSGNDDRVIQFVDADVPQVSVVSLNSLVGSVPGSSFVNSALAWAFTTNNGVLNVAAILNGNQLSYIGVPSGAFGSIQNSNGSLTTSYPTIYNVDFSTFPNFLIGRAFDPSVISFQSNSATRSAREIVDNTQYQQCLLHSTFQWFYQARGNSYYFAGLLDNGYGGRSLQSTTVNNPADLGSLYNNHGSISSTPN